MSLHRSDEVDWSLFTSVVLLISSSSKIAREEIDRLITNKRLGQSDRDRLIRARSRVASLEAIADHYDEEDADA
jgi:hypothetical protein